ncbi:hypothetical protein SLA2020_093870 [Shorea laevis]
MEQPSSAGTVPVELRDCIEVLLKFTFHSHLNGSPEFDLGLSKDFCFSPLIPITGAPESPLSSRLASALYRSKLLGHFSGHIANWTTHH